MIYNFCCFISVRSSETSAHAWSGRMGDGCTLWLPTGCVMWVSKLATHFCTPAALHPFVDKALQYFPEIHIFTSAEGINNYQSALIRCSTWISTCRSLCCHFKFHFSDRFHNNVWHECTKMTAANTQMMIWSSIYPSCILMGMKQLDSPGFACRFTHWHQRVFSSH